MGLQQKDGGNSEIHSALRISRGNEKYNIPDTITFKFTKTAAKSKSHGWKNFFIKKTRNNGHIFHQGKSRSDIRKTHV